MVWRRLAYFSDSLSHSALLGLALGLLYDIPVNAGLLIVCFLFALVLIWVQHKKLLAADTALGIIAHTALAIGIIVVSLADDRRSVDLYAYLFGDILAVQASAIPWIFIAAVLVLLLLIWHWPSLVLQTLHEGLARAEGVRPLYLQLVFMFLMTIVVAISIRVVGIMLITSLLIIPAATARQFARTPEAMAIAASGLGVSAVILGIYTSLHWDTPTGPSIVVVAAVIFVLVALLAARLPELRGR